MKKKTFICTLILFSASMIMSDIGSAQVNRDDYRKGSVLQQNERGTLYASFDNQLSVNKDCIKAWSLLENSELKKYNKLRVSLLKSNLVRNNFEGTAKSGHVIEGMNRCEVFIAMGPTTDTRHNLSPSLQIDDMVWGYPDQSGYNSIRISFGKVDYFYKLSDQDIKDFKIKITKKRR